MFLFQFLQHSEAKVAGYMIIMVVRKDSNHGGTNKNFQKIMITNLPHLLHLFIVFKVTGVPTRSVLCTSATWSTYKIKFLISSSVASEFTFASY